LSDKHQNSRFTTTSQRPASDALATDGRYDTLRLIASLGRQDDYGRYCPATNGGKAGYKRTSEPLTDAVLGRHLNGGPHAGMYIYPAGDYRTRLLVFDLDDHDGNLGWEAVRKAALAVAMVADRYGLRLLPLRSGGGAGAHLAVRWDEPQNGRYVRALAGTIIAEVVWKIDDNVEIRYQEGTGGLAKGQIEIFPKSGRVLEDGYGSLVALPFGRASVPLGHAMLPAEHPVAWPASASVPPVEDEPPRQSCGVATAPIGDIVAALSVIRNDPTTDYDEYVRVGMATKAASGGSQEGFISWDDWAQKRTDKYDAHDTRKRWPTFRPNRSGFGVLVNMAREHVPGWMAPSWKATPYSDERLALEFADEHRDDLRYTAKWKKWHLWDGARWREDITHGVMSLAREFCRRVARTVTKLALATRLDSIQKRTAVMSLALADTALAAIPEQWDADPWLLGTPAGVVDLQTGELRPGDPGDYITMQTAVAPGGNCPLWLKTLDDIFERDQEVIGFVRRSWGTP
jgi:putative DNA primase/helicase